MLDFVSESPLSLSQAARLLPPGRRGRPVTLSCLLRWVLRGLRAPTGEVVRLEAARLGGRWLTTRAALQRFAGRLTPRLDDNSSPAPRSPSRRQRASDQAAAELERLGI